MFNVSDIPVFRNIGFSARECLWFFIISYFAGIAMQEDQGRGIILSRLVYI